jgi:S-adenosylmethionine synthetase
MLFSTEAVSKGHPDKFCDQVSDIIVSHILERTKSKNFRTKGKAAIEVLASGQTIVVAGEYWLPDNETLKDNTIVSLIKTVINDVNYSDNNFQFINLLSRQSEEIRRAVVGSVEIGAGDQGMMFGYACGSESTNYLPTGYFYAQSLMKEYSNYIKLNLAYKPDAKCQISTDEFGNVQKVLISCQHSPDVSQQDIHRDILEFCSKHVPSPQYIINPSGSFISGGYVADAGLTGRKIINDSYGSFAHHGGGAFSGKDPTKVDRSGAYIARYFAKYFVKMGYCSKCEIQLSYGIGVAEPFSINVNTFGTASKATEQYMVKYLKKERITPEYIFTKLDIFNKTIQLYEASKHGHFTNKSFSWELV